MWRNGYWKVRAFVNAATSLEYVLMLGVLLIAGFTTYRYAFVQEEDKYYVALQKLNEGAKTAR